MLTRISHGPVVPVGAVPHHARSVSAVSDYAVLAYASRLVWDRE